MRPLVSIIIVNYNTKRLVEDCIESIKKNTGVTYEIIVVENSTQDGFTAGGRDFRLIKNKENVGFAKGTNQGIRAAKGEYILLLNSDTLVKSGSIDRLVEFARTHTDAGVVGPRLLNKDGSTQASCYRFPGIKNAFLEFFLGRKDLTQKYTPAGSRGALVDAIVGAAFLITPQARKKVGMLNERYFMYYEDLDFCRRAQKAGLKTYYLPDVQIVHYHGESGKGIAQAKDQWRRLIPSSKIYHGVPKHYLLTALLWLGQKIQANKDIVFAGLMVILLIPTYFRLLQPGYFSMQDDLQAFRVYEMDKCFEDFQIPCRWVPDAGYQYGYPQFIYYPPSVYYAGAILHRLGFQYIDSVKILFLLGYLVSALAMYLLVKSFLGRWSAFVAAVLYSFVPYKALEVYVRGALNEFWALSLFPLAFWSSYRLIKSGKVKYLLWLAVSLSLLFITHTLTTMIFLPFFVLWLAFWLWGRWGREILKKLFLAGLLGFGLAAFYLLPLLIERKFAHVESLLSGYFDYRQHFVSLYKLFLDRSWGYGSSGFPDEIINLSTGIPQWLMGIAAVVLAALNIKKHKTLAKLTLMLGGAELVVLFMMHLKSSFIWSQLSFLVWLQFPWRFLSISIFLLAILAGLAVYFAGKKGILLGILAISVPVILYAGFFVPKAWLKIKDSDKFSGISWEKQLTISIFDYLPIYAKLPPPTKAPELPEVLEGEASFTNYEKRSDYQRGEVEVTKDSLIRLPLFDFPGMQVKVDGNVVSHRHDDCRNQVYCLGLITFELSQGKHTIEAKLKRTTVRWAGDLMTLVSIGAVTLVLTRKNGKKLFG